MNEPEVIFPIGPIDDFSVYLPPLGMNCEKELETVKIANSINKKLTSKYNKKPKSGISASFIYAHPADYKGCPMLHANLDDWCKIFVELKAMHIDTVIFQASLWKELNECFYHSTAFKSMRQFNVIETMLAAAEKENMTVFLGGYGSVAGWKSHLTPTEIAAEQNNHRICFEEIYQLGKIAGMYFPSETAFKDCRQVEKEQRMHSLYRDFSSMVKSKDAKLKVIVSPATMHNPDLNDMFKDFWNNVLAGSHVDILMPQDCVGNACSSLADLDSQWQAWKVIADQNQLELWSHTEIFERRSFTKKINLYPAAPERIAAQLVLTEPYVSKHCCWEAISFTSDIFGSEGLRLKQFLQK